MWYTRVLQPFETRQLFDTLCAGLALAISQGSGLDSRHSEVRLNLSEVGRTGQVSGRRLSRKEDVEVLQTRRWKRDAPRRLLEKISFLAHCMRSGTTIGDFWCQEINIVFMKYIN